MTSRRSRPGGVSAYVAAAAQASAAEQAAAAAAAAAAAPAAAPVASPSPSPRAPPRTRRAAAAADGRQPTPEQAAALAARARAAADLPLLEGAALDAHVDRAWRRWRELGAPRYHCAPMVDQSELPFRVLARRHGAQAAYTPMMAARLFAGSGLYRAEHFSTIEDDDDEDEEEEEDEDEEEDDGEEEAEEGGGGGGGEEGGATRRRAATTGGPSRPAQGRRPSRDTDRPLFVQFCSNDPVHFVAASEIVRSRCDYVDLNLGCPQRIAARGKYGAYLMDDLGLVRRLVRAGAECLRLAAEEEAAARAAEAEAEAANNSSRRRRRRRPPPAALLSVKIRLFTPQSGGVEATIAYARMLEAAGASLIAVHGRTRAMRDASNFRADWSAIAAVKAALRVPCLANGDVRSRRDADLLLKATGCEGVMSAEPLLSDPALFSDARIASAPLVSGVQETRGGAGAEEEGGEEGKERDQRQHQHQKQEQQHQQEDQKRQQEQQEQTESAAATTEAPDAAASPADRVAALKAATDPGLLVAPLESIALCREYLGLCATFPVPVRMMRGHVHKLLQDWLAEHTDLRQRLTGGVVGLEGLMGVQEELEARVAATGRDRPVPKPSERQVARELERARAKEEAIAAQAAEEAALAALVEEEQAVAAGGGQGGGGDGEREGAVEAARPEMAALACVRGVGGGG